MLKFAMTMLLILVTNASPDTPKNLEGLARAHNHLPRHKLKDSEHTQHLDMLRYKRDIERSFMKQHQLASKYRARFMRPHKDDHTIWIEYKAENEKIMEHMESTISSYTPTNK